MVNYEQVNNTDLDRQGHRKERTYPCPELVDAESSYADCGLGAGGRWCQWGEDCEGERGGWCEDREGKGGG